MINQGVSCWALLILCSRAGRNTPPTHNEEIEGREQVFMRRGTHFGALLKSNYLLPAKEKLEWMVLCGEPWRKHALMH